MGAYIIFGPSVLTRRSYSTEELSYCSIPFMLRSVFRLHPGRVVVRRIQRAKFIEVVVWVGYGALLK